jgi:CubicO group peptidase (beta-lactamase class C family)
MRTLLYAFMLACIPAQAFAQGDTTTPTNAFSVAVNCPRFQVCPELTGTLDSLVPLGIKYFNVPGTAIALIQDGKVVYARSFGVRNIASGEPFTLDTVYRIGSTSKAMTSMLVATDVDQGLLAWDTTVHSLRSDFQLPNQELTDTIQVQQLMNMGTGIRDAPFLEYADLDSPEHLWHTVKNLEVFAPPETTFDYNNSIYALGGYVGALAQGVPIPGLLDSYKQAMKSRIFDPIDMPTTEVTDKPETLSNNIATPYQYDLTQDVYPLHPNTY